MSLLTLPNELILLIAETLPMKDVNSLHRTSHHLACLTTSTLYRFAVQERSTPRMTFPPLHWAAWRGYVPLAKLLLDKGFEIDARASKHGKTALHFAAWHGSEGVVRFLLDRGAAVDSRSSKYGKSALHYAAVRGRESIVRLLLERGADVNIRDHTGQTVLILAARFQKVNEPSMDTLRLLLEGGAGEQIDARDYKRGETALHWAVRKGRLEMVKVFRGWGASAGVVNSKGETAVNSALVKKDDQIMMLLVGSTGVSGPSRVVS